MVDESDRDADRPDDLDRLLERVRDPEPAPDEDPLSPEDLDFTDREAVRRRGDHQFVVSTDPERAPTPDQSTDAAEPERADETGGLPARDALAEMESAYGVVLSAKTDAGVATTTVSSNNIVEVFEDALTWYAGQVDDSLPPSEVVSLLLEQSDLDAEL